MDITDPIAVLLHDARPTRGLCFGCEREIETHEIMFCPGHVEADGIRDHCPDCVAAGKCEAIRNEFQQPPFIDAEQVARGFRYIEGYPVKGV